MSSHQMLDYGNGRWLTAIGEAALHQVYEKRAQETRADVMEKAAERSSMAQSVRAALSHHYVPQAAPVPKKNSQESASTATTTSSANSESNTSSAEPSESQQAKDIMKALKKRKVASNDETKGEDKDDAVNDKDEPSESLSARKLALPGTSIKKRKTLHDAGDSDDDSDASYTPSDPQDLFSADGIISDTEWNSLKTPERQHFTLSGFGFQDKQTLGLKLTVPDNAKSWSLNICPENDRFGSNIYLHMNPRYAKQKLIMNDKQGTWGSPSNKVLGTSSKQNGLLAKDIDLMIQLRPEGFFIIANEVLSGFFAHRRDPTEKTPSSGDTSVLKLAMNSHDDNGNPQQIILHKVWWGRREPSRNPIPSSLRASIVQPLVEAQQAVQARLAEQPQTAMHKRSLLAEGLPTGISDLKMLQGLEFTLFQVFEEFQPEAIAIVPMQGFAFVRLTSAELVQSAIEGLDGAVIGEAEPEEGTEGGDSSGGGEYELKLSPMLP